jgi:type I restriction enzyme S subunit
MSDKIPKGWKWVKLGEVVTLQRGYDLPKSKMKKGNIPVVGSNGIIGYHNKATTKAPGITIGRSGNIGNAYLHKSDFWAHNTTLYVKDFKGNDVIFLFYLFKNIDFNQLNAGSAVPTLNRNHIYPIEVKIPIRIEDQKAIAEVLSSIDDKIDLLHRQNKTLEEMAMTLFRKWFIEDAKEDWGDGVFGDIVQPKKGKNITKKEVIEGPYPVVAGGIEPSCYHNLANTSEPVVTISASGANAGYVRLYHTKVWASDSSYIDYSVTPYVYFSYIFLKTNQKAIFDKQVGSVQPHVYPMQIMELNCMHYPEKLISKFEKWCTHMFTKIKSNQLQIRTLEQLRDTLLPKLMSGEVRVKV